VHGAFRLEEDRTDPSSDEMKRLEDYLMCSATVAIVSPMRTNTGKRRHLVWDTVKAELSDRQTEARDSIVQHCTHPSAT
jgi:hypothetical protein